MTPGLAVVVVYMVHNLLKENKNKVTFQLCVLKPIMSSAQQYKII